MYCSGVSVLKQYTKVRSIVTPFAYATATGRDHYFCFHPSREHPSEQGRTATTNHSRSRLIFSTNRLNPPSWSTFLRGTRRAQSGCARRGARPPRVILRLRCSWRKVADAPSCLLFAACGAVGREHTAAEPKYSPYLVILDPIKTKPERFL